MAVGDFNGDGKVDLVVANAESNSVSILLGNGAGTFQAAGHTNSLYVQMLYYTILGRDPDSAGLAFWVGVANGGDPGVLFQAAGYGTRIQILGSGAPNQGFIGSPEFQGLFLN